MTRSKLCTVYPRPLTVRRSMLLLTLGLSLALTKPASVDAAGAGGAYRVEVVIFRTTDTPTGEDLRANAEGRGFNGQLERGASPPSVLRKLDASQMQLGAMASRLRSSGSWRVVAHAAWIQSATAWPHHAGLSLEQVGINAPGLTGSVYVEHGQFLHLGFDLHLGSDPAWSLSELRKIKFNEKNYFDHPGFGVIAIVSPAARGAN